MEFPRECVSDSPGGASGIEIVRRLILYSSKQKDCMFYSRNLRLEWVSYPVMRTDRRLSATAVIESLNTYWSIKRTESLKPVSHLFFY